MKPLESKTMRIALVCDWLTGMRGGERCLDAACQLYPDADIYTLVHIPGSVSPEIESHSIHTSYIQKLPGKINNFRRYLPLFPGAFRKFNFDNYDLVLSFSHCAAKGIRPSSKIPHICYCHTPMRYAWELRNEYLKNFSLPKRILAGLLLDYLKYQDKNTASNVTHFIANSHCVQARIKKSYNRDSDVINPPVDCSRFSISTEDCGYYLVLSALVPYKRIDLAVEAFRDFDRELLIIGSGTEMGRLKSIAGKNIRFLDNPDDEQVSDYLRKCTALILPGLEDFGIAPLEAQACGKAVIAYGQGGVSETVLPLGDTPSGKAATGVFFYEQTPPALKKAVIQFENRRKEISPSACRQNALRFDLPIFKQRLRNYVLSAMSLTAKENTDEMKFPEENNVMISEAQEIF